MRSCANQLPEAKSQSLRAVVDVAVVVVYRGVVLVLATPVEIVAPPRMERETQFMKEGSSSLLETLCESPLVPPIYPL